MMPKTTSKTSTTKKKRAVKPRELTWEVVEQAPRKRWWWWVAVVYFTIFFTVVALWYEEWSLAALIPVMAVMLGLAYSSRNRHPIFYTLRGSTLTRERAKITKDGTRQMLPVLTRDLTSHPSCYIGDPWRSGKSVSPTQTLVLLPPRANRFKNVFTIVLPDDEKKRTRVLKHIEQYVPFASEDDPKFASWRSGERLVSWLTRIIGL